MNNLEKKKPNQKFILTLKASIIFSLMALYLLGILTILGFSIIIYDYEIAGYIKSIFIFLIIIVVVLVCYWVTNNSIRYYKEL